MLCHGHGVDREFVRCVKGRGVNRRFIARSVGGHGVGESDGAGGWRVSDSGGGRRNGCFYPQDGDLFKLRVLKDLKFKISARKSEGRDKGSCSGVPLVRDTWSLLPGRE